MRRTSYDQPCPVAAALDLVGDRWTLLVVRDLLRGPQRFKDLEDSLPGIAANVLSERLQKLESAEIVSRSFYSEHPPRAQYALTDKGRQLGLVVAALAVWGREYAFAGAGLIHTKCGQPVAMRLHCERCRRTPAPEDLRIERLTRR